MAKAVGNGGLSAFQRWGRPNKYGERSVKYMPGRIVMDKPLASPRQKGGAALQALRLCDRRRLLFDSKVLGPAIWLRTSKRSRRRIFGRHWVALSFVFSPRRLACGHAGSAQSRLATPVSAVCFFATRPD
jgi:hypothetical protein